MKFKQVCEEVDIKTTLPQTGYGIEISQDQMTAKKELTYYFIVDGKKEKVPEDRFMKTTPNKIHDHLEKAESAIYNMNIRKYFKDKNPDIVDIVAAKEEDGKFRIRATSDNGNLQLRWDGKQLKKA